MEKNRVERQLLRARRREIRRKLKYYGLWGSGFRRRNVYLTAEHYGILRMIDLTLVRSAKDAGFEFIIKPDFK